MPRVGFHRYLGIKPYVTSFKWMRSSRMVRASVYPMPKSQLFRAWPTASSETQWNLRGLQIKQCWIKSVLRIHDILVWIRIHGSCYFLHWPSRGQQKTIFKTRFFYFLLFEGTFSSFFKEKSHKEVTTMVESRFSYYFCLVIKGSWSGAGSRSIPLTNGSGSRRPKNIGYGSRRPNT